MQVILGLTFPLNPPLGKNYERCVDLNVSKKLIQDAKRKHSPVKVVGSTKVAEPNDVLLHWAKNEVQDASH